MLRDLRRDSTGIPSVTRLLDAALRLLLPCGVSSKKSTMLMSSLHTKQCGRRSQECVRCCAAMLDLGADEAGSPAAVQLERHIQQFVKVSLTA